MFPAESRNLRKLAKECYSMKLELLTNATVVDDAIRFVSTRRQPIQSRFWEKGYKYELNSNIFYKIDVPTYR